MPSLSSEYPRLLVGVDGMIVAENSGLLAIIVGGERVGGGSRLNVGLVGFWTVPEGGR